MSVESATNISQLDPTKPSATDPKSEGDDHIRLLKYTIQMTLPSITGVSYAATSNSNFLLATTSMVQAAILNASGITAVLPAQVADTYLYSDGTNVSFQPASAVGSDIYLNSLYGAF
jgi:hypothetical protein